MYKIIEAAKLRTVTSSLGKGVEAGVAGRPVLQG